MTKTRILGHYWRVEHKPNEHVGNIENEFKVSSYLWENFSVCFNCYITAAPVTVAQPMKVWAVALIGGGAGTFLVSLGKKTSFVGFVINHFGQSDFGEATAKFKAKVISGLMANEVHSDDISLSMDGMLSPENRVELNRMMR